MTLFYSQLRHANIRANSWENLATETRWYIDAWMGSKGYRKNMLLKSNYKIGIDPLVVLLYNVAGLNTSLIA